MADLEQSTPPSQPQERVFARTALAEPIMLECDLPGAGTPGVPIGYGAAWHGLLLIDKTWQVNDYAFVKEANGEILTISRSSGVFTQENIRDKSMRRTGTCHRASPEKNRF
jgi:hypothetical protein